jgi:type I restriction enzyme S subunit
MTLPHYEHYIPTGIDWLGGVPSHWTVAALAYRYTVELGKMLDGKAITGSHLAPYLRNSDVQWGVINTTDLPTMDFAPDERERFRLRHGDLLACEGGDVGRCAVWTDTAECYYQKALHRLRPKRPTEDSALFLRWLLESAAKRGCFTANEAKATIAHLPAETFRRYRFPFPPIDEQRAIVTFLDRETSKIDALVAEQERLIELLEEKRQALITHAVTKGIDPSAALRDSGCEWIGQCSSDWVVTPIRFVARLESGHTPSRSHPEYWEDCTVPWFSLADVWQIRELGRKVIVETGEKISELGISNSAARRLPAGTVMLSRTASVGFAAIMGVEMATTQDFANWVCGPRIRPEFLLYVFKAMRGEFSRLMMGSTHNTIYMPDIASFRCALPPLDEQDSIVAYLDDAIMHIDVLSAEAARAVDLLKERRAALITAAVTGQIDVRGAA